MILSGNFWGKIIWSHGGGHMILWPPLIGSWGGPWPLGPSPGYAPESIRIEKIEMRGAEPSEERQVIRAKDFTQLYNYLNLLVY